MEATPIKLKNGNWGARVRGGACEGDIVQIRAKSGKSWSAAVARVLWTGADRRGGGTVSICATRRAGGGRRRRRSGGCVECGGPVVDARHHRAMGGYCGECAFDEFDM